MKNVNLPTLMAGEIVVHASTATVGRVVNTLYPLNHKMADIEQELLLLDGSKRTLKFLELTLANRVQARPFLATATAV